MFFSWITSLAALISVLTNQMQLPPQPQEVVAESRFVDVCPTLYNAKEVAYLHQQGHHEPLNVIEGCYASQVVVTDDMPQYWRYPAGGTEFLVVGVTIDGQALYGVIEFANDETAPMDDIPQADVESVVAEVPTCATIVVQPCTDIDEEGYE
jgi:hypothetical protein